MDLTYWIEQNKGHALDALKELVRIQSDAGDPVHTSSGEIYPFGQGVQDAFAYMLSKGEEYGFSVQNVDGYGGHIQWTAGPAAETVGILGHLDVVPAQDGWSFDPYGGEETGGDGPEGAFLQGRGTTDDKGPLLAAFYAMKALKDAGYEPRRRIRLILGLDEETGMTGMRHYLEQEGPPDIGFTPDGDFPVDSGEMGMIVCELARKLSRGPTKGLALTRLSGGNSPTMVPDRARAVVKADKAAYEVIRQKAADFGQETGHKIRCRGVGKSLELLADGKGCHGATPWAGLNAISVMFDFLGRLNFVNEDLNDFIQFYNRHIGYALDGSGMGCMIEDDLSGKTIWNTGMVSYDGDSITLNVNIRVPVSSSVEAIYAGMTPVLDEYDLGIVKLREIPPHYYPDDHPLVKTLLEVYRDMTGDEEARPLVIGGETYAKCCRNVVAFGGLFPGDPDVMHQKDEKIQVRRFYQLIEIYAEAIQRLDQMAIPADIDANLEAATVATCEEEENE
ncbi:Sapep family Mn(2+)-dependent dipeptidase [Eubacterium sp. AB3007]|uniref:Sapep family Mn(2+)-dependent dipeptidase n=1 Tax=Eubacterium sp. AB3007 TaxID=1392487 RepID=UPI00068F8DAA|nr:Sapep family Mn(2+)-dependent dipeptidase [Eubacterium sp. AB3007]